MAFPTGTISAQDIRNQMAANNTNGVQMNVALGDISVRSAANRPSGPVSYGDLRGVNVLFSGYMTLVDFPGGNAFGYNANGTPVQGSVQTNSYYKIPTFTGGSVAGQPAPIKVVQEMPGSPGYTIVSFASNSTYLIVQPPVYTVYLTVNNTRIAITSEQLLQFGSNNWQMNIDTGVIQANINQSVPVVLTY